MRGRTRALLIVAVVLALVGGATAVVVARRSSTARLDERRLDAALRELEAFVEQARGLRFLQAPKVEVLGDKAFDRVYSGDGSSTEQPVRDDDVYTRVLRALGFNVDGGSGGGSSSAAGGGPRGGSASDDVAGFYDTDTKVLYVRGVTLTPYVRDVLVHELVHALDDQHFGIAGNDNADDDATSAYDALVEGNATEVEMRWFSSRPKAERDAIVATDGYAPGEGTDSSDPSVDAYDRFDAFPYEAGPRFVAAVLAAGGQARLDAAFAAPPKTTEDVMHPERFIAGDEARPVDLPEPDGRSVDSGTMGELGLLLLLDQVVDRATADRAAEGWGGDEYVAWRASRRTCVRWNIVMDTPTDTSELLTALSSWATRHQSASVAPGDGNRVTVTNCA